MLRGWRLRSLGALWSLGALTPAVLAQMPLDLGQALVAARSNLEVNISQRNLDAARADVVSADRSPFPVLSASTSSIDLQHGVGGGNVWRDKRIDKGVGLDYTYERGDKRALRTRTADRAAQAAEHDLAQSQREQLSRVSAAYMDWLAQLERLRHLGQLAANSRQQARVAEQRGRAGDLARQEVMRWQIEARRAEAALPAALSQAQGAALVLQQLTRLAQPPQGWRPVQGWPVAEPELTEPSRWPQNMPVWVAQRPDLIAAAERVESAHQAVALAQSLQKSDITWGANLDHHPGTSTRLLALRLQIPLQLNYNHQGEIARAQARLRQSMDQLEQTRELAQVELLSQLQQHQAAWARWQAHEQDIIPQARQVLTQAQMAYEKGALTLTDLLDARRTYQQTWLDGLEARRDHAVAYARLVWQTREPEQAQRRLLATPPYAEHTEISP